MTDDIVTRLREHWEAEKMLGNDWLCEVLRDASEEIERLLYERDCWKKVAEKLANELGKTEYAHTEYQNLVDSE